jgi:hypothetical protein
LVGRIERPVILVALEIGEAFRGPDAAEIERISAAHPSILSSEPMAQAKQAGIAPEKFERIVVAAGTQWLAVAAFSDNATLAKFRKSMFPDGREEIAGDRKLLVGGRAPAAYQPTDLTLAIGTREGIESTWKPAAGEPGWGVRAFQAVAREKPFLAVQIDAALVAPQLRADFGKHGLASLFDAQAWRLVCKKTAKGLHFRLSAHFENAAQATASVEALRAVQSMLVAYFNVAALQIPAMLRDQAETHPEGPKIAPTLESSLKRISLAFGKSPPQAVAGTSAIDCEIETETPAVDMLALINLLPRGKKESPRP